MATSGLEALGCPMPFILESDFPFTGGERVGRFCGNTTAGLACCLPCPIEEWIYSDGFPHQMSIAYWLNVPALVLQVFLLVTFLVLPEEVSHRHHLSVGLCVSLIVIELSFIIPLGTKPHMCHDEITPKNMYDSMSCAWSGAMLVAGAMGCAVWIMLRSLYIHLRVCWDLKQTRLLFILTQALGWGLTLLFFAITIPITGVSYRIGTTCLPNQKNAFVTWFGWLIAFACIATLLQFATTVFCLWLYLVRNQGRKEGCLSITKVLGLNENTIVASFMLAALIGILTFLLMVRRSMLLGWYHLFLHPRRPSIGEEDFIIVSPKRRSLGRQLDSEKQPPQLSNINTIAASKADRDGPLLSPVSPMTPSSPNGVLPDATTPATEHQRNLSIPQAGEVDRRHETTNWFDDGLEDDGRRESRRVSKLDDLA